MKWLVASVLLVCSLTAQGQSCSKNDFDGFTNTGASIRFFMANPGIVPSVDEKVVMRAGDAAAIAILKTYSEKQLSSPLMAKQAGLVLRMAFSYPRLISACSDQRPKVTMLLLDHLLSLNKENDTFEEIKNAKAFITQQTAVAE